MKITIAAATSFELQENLLQNPKHDIRFLYTGVGILSSAVSLTQHVFQSKPDLIIQAGIAGCLNENLILGNVVVIETEYLGDTGVWEGGEWKDLFDMNLLQNDKKPFQNRGLVNNRIDEFNKLNLDKVNGVTVNQITTGEQQRLMLKQKYKAGIESMEGASLHYVCTLFDIPFIQIRSISNIVGERDKSKWKMKDAIENVNETVSKMIDLL